MQGFRCSTEIGRRTHNIWIRSNLGLFPPFTSWSHMRNGLWSSPTSCFRILFQCFSSLFHDPCFIISHLYFCLAKSLQRRNVYLSHNQRVWGIWSPYALMMFNVFYFMISYIWQMAFLKTLYCQPNNINSMLISRHLWVTRWVGYNNFFPWITNMMNLLQAWEVTTKLSWFSISLRAKDTIRSFDQFKT